MNNKEIPFRPKLDGNFRLRFYNAASKIAEGMSPKDLGGIAEREIAWVEDECSYNLEQRKKYRAIWFLFKDLVLASWRPSYRGGVLYMSMPNLDFSAAHAGSPLEAKALLRSWMSGSAHERVLTYAEFVRRLERPNGVDHTISDLIADGEELSDRLRRASDGDVPLSEAVKPYLQLVEEGGRDDYTGIRTAEIWRYFRLTWSNPAETTPGRTLQYLIRDAAHPMHAVMGIVSLENCAVQITDRDNYIGWNPTAFIDRIAALSHDEAKKEFELLLKYVEAGISGIDYGGLCSESVVENPRDEDVRRLLGYADAAERNRQELLKEAAAGGIADGNKSELGGISKKTEAALFRRKRAERLARLLAAKTALSELCRSERFEETWTDFCESENGKSSIRTALLAQKIQHIGSSLMELNVCGAVPPYNEILGGKLAALLALSPQVVHDYKERYSGKASMIASRLKGKKVYRPAELVYVGTTSLYHVGSSQYNRLKIPKSVFDSDFDVEWKKLGTTVGYGTMHISKAATLSLTEAISDGYNLINHVFGEGPSPKFRLITKAIRELLESANDDSKEFTKHAMSRIVYGARLASNMTDYLMGKTDAPKYYADVDAYKKETQKIVDYWTNRWLSSRLSFEPMYRRVRDFDKASFLVGSQIKEDEGWTFKKLEETPHMPPNDSEKTGLQFIRDFYRGISAYADHVDGGLLAKIHLKTKLDDAVMKAAESGKDVVLTGNPGDGKSHLIRILEEKLKRLPVPAVVELDASTLSNEEIFQRWKGAREARAPFVLAINAAVLYALRDAYPDFEPAKEAYSQMVRSVVFHDEAERSDSVATFCLDKRDVLTKEIVEQAILKMTSEEHYGECEQCKMRDDCVAKKNCKLLREPLFQTRLNRIFSRVSLQGRHATLRELQGFISYLIFGDRTCKKLNQTAGNRRYDLVSLIYSGKGNLFDAVRRSFDPINISHPVLDEKILLNDVDPASWVEGYEIPAEAIAYDNDELFNLRKRQFYFFNSHGAELFDVLDDDAAKFQKFLEQPDDGKMIKELIVKLNGFFGTPNASNAKLRIWLGLRYNNEPRKVLISAKAIRKSEFCIGRPALLRSMRDGIDMTANYVRLEKKDDLDICLKIDFEMYRLLNAVEKGVPVLFMESDQVKKVWRFVEQLQSSADSEEEDAVEISLMDVQNKRTMRVSIDREDRRYSSIEHERTRTM